jgi:hypothetical protein
MCGIAGELRLRNGEHADVERVRAMCDVMVHRGPDDFGGLAHAEVALGMRRLSIVDVGGGKQPLGSEDGSVQVVCNGEIYNSPALRSGLLARGPSLSNLQRHRSHRAPLRGGRARLRRATRGDVRARAVGRAPPSPRPRARPLRHQAALRRARRRAAPLRIGSEVPPRGRPRGPRSITRRCTTT